jgi:endonuclease/exonuclease/phosphatase family metal-dependent hydrolase
VRAVAAWAYANVMLLIVAPWLVGQVFRDRFHLTGLCMFVPSVVVAATLLLVAATAWLVTCRRAALAAALLALPPLVVTLAVENRWWRSVPTPPGQTLRLVHWNVKGGMTHLDEFLLKRPKADVYVFSEAYSESRLKRFIGKLGADYQMNRAHGMAVLVRGSITRPASPRVKGRAYVFRCTIDGLALCVLVADLPSLPIIHRAPFLRQVRQLTRATRPDLIVGDFNTSRRSHFLNEMPAGYRHAYYEAGKGWSYTWPAQLPLWAIDQCIAGPRVECIRYDLTTTRWSDHRMQTLEFALRAEP